LAKSKKILVSRHAWPQRGISLIELIMFIVIIGVALAGVLLVMNRVTASSADPLVRKQALAIAESLLEEIELMPFTFCDPDDVNAASAVSAADCTGGAGGANDQNKGGAALTSPTPAAETRVAATFDNVADYGNYSMAGVVDMTGTAVTGLDGYAASVGIARAGTALLGAAADDGAALRITVTVTGPGNTQVVLYGYRTRYVPRSVP
jgi:MSHA pilin protein MshD